MNIFKQIFGRSWKGLVWKYTYGKGSRGRRKITAHSCNVCKYAFFWAFSQLGLEGCFLFSFFKSSNISQSILKNQTNRSDWDETRGKRERGTKNQTTLERIPADAKTTQKPVSLSCGLVCSASSRDCSKSPVNLSSGSSNSPSTYCLANNHWNREKLHRRFTTGRLTLDVYAWHCLNTGIRVAQQCGFKFIKKECPLENS